jgi:hypothetical protein
MGSSLVVDFHGPIAFRIGCEFAWVYVPKCDYHTCNILTDTNDDSPDSATYSVSWPGQWLNGNKTRQPVSGAAVISVPWNSSWSPQEADCYCIFQFPTPDYLFGLSAEQVKVDSVDGDGYNYHEDGAFARGLRFYYEHVGVPRITPEPKIRRPECAFDATYFQHDLADPQYRIEIRYYRYKPEADGENDAESCSQQMRNLFPPLDKWTVSFPDPTRGLVDSPGPKGVDCGANGMVLSDDKIALEYQQSKKK